MTVCRKELSNLRHSAKAVAQHLEGGKVMLVTRMEADPHAPRRCRGYSAAVRVIQTEKSETLSIEDSRQRGAVDSAQQEVGRHPILTHCYWREGGSEFNNVNIMAVCHGTEKDRVFAHKAAIDAHLAAIGMPVSYTNVFWGGRSEIKPSEISPKIHREWLEKMRAPEAVGAV